MAIHIQLRRKNAATWIADNSVLYEGEIGLERDTFKYKMGNGVTAWNSLPYMREGGVVYNDTALPTGGDIEQYQLFYLTGDDNVAKCSEGMYIHDGTGWNCLFYNKVYDLGNSGATPSYTVIPGCCYSLTQDQNITVAPVITFTRVGVIDVIKTGAFTIAGKPTMGGRTSKEMATDAWTPAASALSHWVIQDTGTYLISQASSMV